MKKIKSFREYIEEQKLLKEADDSENKAGFLKSAEEKVDDREKELTRDGSDESTSENANNPKPEEQKKEEKSNSSESAYVGEALPVTNATLKIDARTPVGIVDELKLKAEIIERTYNQLDSFVEKKKVVPVGEKHPQAVFNLTNNQTFKTIKETWLKEYHEKIDAQRKNQEDVSHINTLKNTKSFLGYMSKSKKEAMAKARKALDDKFPIEKENNAEEKKDSSVNEEVINEFRNPFITAGELASGIRNKYNRSGVLKKIGNLYGNIENTSIEEMYRKYVKDARALIAKQKKTGWAYLQRAKKNLASYLEKHKYLKKTTDEQFIRTITDDLQRSMNVLYYIGSDLQNLMGEYNKSLNKISNELEVQDIKNKEYVKNSLDSNTAISRYDKKSSDQAVKKGEEEEAKDIENAKAKEREAFHKAIVTGVQKDIDAAKEIDQKAGILFYDILQNASKKGDISPEFLLKKLESDSNRKTKDGVKWTDEDRFASVEAIYALAKFLTDNNLEDFQTGKRSIETNTSNTDKLYNVLSSIPDGNIEELVDKTKELLLSPEELKKIKTQKEAEKSSEKLKEEAKNRKKLQDRVESEVTSFVKNNPINYDIVLDKIKGDIKNRKTKFSKVDSENFLPEEQESASAITSYILLCLLKNKEAKKVKKEGLDSISLFNYFEKAYKMLLKHYKKASVFNKSLKRLAEYNANLSKSTRRMSGVDTTTSEKDKNEEEKKHIDFENNESAAKDFDGEQPKSIYAYAIQKAKKLQER